MSSFPELMNEIARQKNECITSTKQVSENDEKIHSIIDKTIDSLECSIDVCSYPNREVQIPLSKIYTEDIPHANNDELMIKVVERFNSYKSAFEDTSKQLTDLIYTYRKKLSDLKEPVTNIKNETDKLYPKFKEAINILAQPLTIVVEGFEVEEFRKKQFKNKDVLSKFKQLLDYITERLICQHFLCKNQKVFIATQICSVPRCIRLHSQRPQVHRCRLVDRLCKPGCRRSPDPLRTCKPSVCRKYPRRSS